ncbi:aspartyl protease APCB1 isoform X1 [Diospyros lotus]|uniref:aspartyl protease APCB1 isoform X1 n=1 Tax=Diospyros lotus TaxID=55363 RepID=UPI00224E2980|nr:aspartyl protease APCB1 isoform X1 [Diospyros lotus]
MESGNSPDSPQPVGVVIITLPPADNPSQAKTITAFTLSDLPPLLPLLAEQPKRYHPLPDPSQAKIITAFTLSDLPPPPPPAELPECIDPLSDPSQAKTITTFTLSDLPLPALLPAELPEHHHPLPDPPLPYHSALNPEPHLLRRAPFLFDNRGVLFGLLGLTLVALILLAFPSSNALFKLHSPNDESDRSPSSFFFPLFLKLGVRKMSQRDIMLKFGRVLRKDSQNLLVWFNDGLKYSKNSKLVSTASNFDSTAILPLRGNVYPDGLYFTYVLVGSPPKPYFLDMDTGSDLTWVQCDAPCTSCAKGAHPLYKPTKSKIIPSKDSLCAEVQRNQKTGYCETCLQCDYEIEYADQSSSMGVLARDEFRLMFANGSFMKSNFVFGCAYDQQGLLLNSLGMTDGIVGLSRAKVSLPSQLASQGIINNVVGHCLTTDAGLGGYMFLGDELVPYWKMSWVPMLNSLSTNLYHSEIVKMNYGNKKLSLGGKDDGPRWVVFDSGSSYTYFTKKAYSDLIASLKDISNEGHIQDVSDPTLPICWQAKFPVRSVSEVKQYFKPLTLQLGGKWWFASRRFHIQPEGYLVISKNGNVCLGILDGSKEHDGAAFILGDVSLRGQLVVYDNVRQKIGWARSDCIRPLKLKDLPPFVGMDL